MADRNEPCGCDESIELRQQLPKHIIVKEEAFDSDLHSFRIYKLHKTTKATWYEVDLYCKPNTLTTLVKAQERLADL